MRQPKVSVILPSLNVAAYIREALESVICQELDNLEIICVDAGSTDGTLDILREYEARDRRVRVLLSDRKSYGFQMNLGMAAAGGDYIGIVETDDYADRSMYADLSRIADEHSLDFVKADFYRFTGADPKNRQLVLEKLDREGSHYHQLLSPRTSPELIRLTMNTWAGIYRRRFLEEHQIRHNETPGAAFQDNGFFFQTFLYAERAMLVDRPYYYNRRDNPNSSVRQRDKIYAMNIEYDFIQDILKRDEKTWNSFKYVYWWKKFHSYWLTLNRIDKACRQEFISRMSREYARAMQLGELRREEYNDWEWEQVSQMVNREKLSYQLYVDVPAWQLPIRRLVPGPVKRWIKWLMGIM